MRTGLKTPSWRYLLSGRASDLGVRYRADLPVRAGAAPVSTALTIYTKTSLFVTSPPANFKFWDSHLLALPYMGVTMRLLV